MAGLFLYRLNWRARVFGRVEVWMKPSTSPHRRWRFGSPPPSVEDNIVAELHVDTYRLERGSGFSKLTISKDYGVYLGFLVMEHRYAGREIGGAKLGNSRLFIDGG